jgi:hypothetical protein
VRSELDDSPVLEDADTVGMADGRESMRDEYGGAMPRRCEQTIEDFGFPSYVELRGRLVEKNYAPA